jgi:hypothetical protein
MRKRDKKSVFYKKYLGISYGSPIKLIACETAIQEFEEIAKSLKRD